MDARSPPDSANGDNSAAEWLARAQSSLQAQQWLPLQGQLAALLARRDLSEAQRVEALLLQAAACWRQGDLPGVTRPALQAATLAGDLAGLRRQCIRALGFAAFALSELGLADSALPHALRGLALAQDDPAQHQALPGALSCAAHVHARLGQFDEAEMLHMQALSLARESGLPEALHQAYANLFSAVVSAHGELASAAEQAQAVRAAQACAQRHASHVLGFLDDKRLGAYRCMVLMLNLGDLLSLAGRLDDAEPLLRRCLMLAEEQGTRYYQMSAEAALADLLLRRDRPSEAYSLLRRLLDPEGAERGSSLHLLALRTALACQRRLGDRAAAELLQTELAAFERARAQVRARALAMLGETV